MPPPLNEDEFGPENLARIAHVSRETISRLKLYASMLQDWNTRQNLVSEKSLRTMWLRHFWDSAQLADFVVERARSLVDLGSGAGFPGLVLAELLRQRSMRIVLYESIAKKRDFLSAVAARLDLKVEIRAERIEAAPAEVFDLVTARALAPLPKLLDYAQRFWGPDTVGLFLKGQNLAAELTSAHNCWTMQPQIHASRSSQAGTVLKIRELKRVASNRTGSR